MQLLQQAGWTRGTGLGVQGQGRTQPILAWLQRGRTGIGMAEPSPQHRSDTQPPTQHPPQPPQQQKAMECSRGHPEGERVAARQLQAVKPKAPKRGWEAVAVEEPSEARSKRVRQALQAEHHHESGKRIQRSLYRALREGDGSAQDSTPLLRSHHRLRARNPLL